MGKGGVTFPWLDSQRMGSAFNRQGKAEPAQPAPPGPTHAPPRGPLPLLLLGPSPGRLLLSQEGKPAGAGGRVAGTWRSWGCPVPGGPWHWDHATQRSRAGGKGGLPATCHSRAGEGVCVCTCPVLWGAAALRLGTVLCSGGAACHLPAQCFGVWGGAISALGGAHGCRGIWPWGQVEVGTMASGGSGGQGPSLPEPVAHPPPMSQSN